MNSTKFKVACIQLNTELDTQKNLELINKLVTKAAKSEANFVLLPEHAPYFLYGSREEVKKIVTKSQLRSLDFFITLAKKLNIWLTATLGCHENDSDLLFNRTYLINNLGSVVASYDKIHLFNASLGINEAHQESNIYQKGSRIVTAKTPWGNLGFAICYDLRFPLLFQLMRQQNVDFFCIPSAFTETTGKAHWHTLIKSRAIETSCYVFAPNQYGLHLDRLSTYGHSLIVSPWGEILAECKNSVGFITAVINTDEIDKARKLISSSSQSFTCLNSLKP